MAQAQAALRQLLEHCMFARRAEALALLDLQPGLLNLRWAGAKFGVNGKETWTNTTALIMAGKGGDLALVLALLERGADLHARDDNIGQHSSQQPSSRTPQRCVSCCCREAQT